MKYNKQIIEIRKDIIFKKDYRSQYIIVIAIFAEQERIDNDLQKMNWESGKGTKYISFKNSTSDARLRALYVNEINNVEVKYKYIINIDLSEEVEY